jgi:hypothetical protein
MSLSPNSLVCQIFVLTQYFEVALGHHHCGFDTMLNYAMENIQETSERV